MILLTVVNFALIVYMIIFKPFEHPGSMFVNIFTELCFIIYHVISAVSCDEISCSNTGYAIVSVVMITMFLHLGLFLIRLVKEIIYKIKYYKNHWSEYRTLTGKRKNVSKE